MKYSLLIQKAIDLAIQVHEVHQKQKRKGKDIAYITHPLTVGLILARAGASEEVIAAGILHDTIEDSHDDTKITAKDIEAQFGREVAELVSSVSETDKTLSWAERKNQALAHVEHFTRDEVLLKSADVISNTSEIYADFKKDGTDTFKRFNAGGPDILIHTAKLIEALKNTWPESPLYADLEEAACRVATMYTIYRNTHGKSLGLYDVSSLSEQDIDNAAARIAEEMTTEAIETG